MNPTHRITRRDLLRATALAGAAAVALPAIPPNDAAADDAKPVPLPGPPASLWDAPRFRVTVKGPTMLPEFPAGTIIECRHARPSDVRDGDFVVVRVGERATFRQARRPGKAGVLLRETNPATRQQSASPVTWASVDSLAVVVGVFVPAAIGRARRKRPAPLRMLFEDVRGNPAPVLGIGPDGEQVEPDGVEFFSAEQAAARHGLDVDTLRRMWRAVWGRFVEGGAA